MNKVNNISNTSTVLVLPMYICNLPILCEHECLSAIVEWTQSDHSGCRHWMEGMSTTKPGTDTGRRDSPVASVARPPAARSWVRAQEPATGSRVATVGQLLFAPWAWAYSTLHPLGVGK